MTPTNRIEHSCRIILKELKDGRFTKLELILLDRLFSKLLEFTKKLLIMDKKEV